MSAQTDAGTQQQWPTQSDADAASAITRALHGDDPDTWWLRGYHDEHGRALVALVDAHGATIGHVPHYAKHAGGVFAWGDVDDPSAEAARCVLLACVDTAQCPQCRATRRLVYDVDGYRPFSIEHDTDPETWVFDCIACDDGFRSLPYHEFQVATVCALDRSWDLAVADVRAWLSEKGVPL